MHSLYHFCALTLGEFLSWKEKKHEKQTDASKNKTSNAPRFRRITQKKPYNAITISELTREADIDRRTFYLHYECIEDLVAEMQQLARNMIAEQLKNCENVQLDTLFDGLTNVVRDKMDFYRVIFTEPSCSAFFEDGVAAIKYCILASNPDSTLSDQQKEYYTEYIANGIMGLYAYWFRQDNPELSLDAFTEIAKSSMAESIRLIRHG